MNTSISISSSIKAAVDRAPIGTAFRASDFSGSRAAVDTALFRLAASDALVNPRRGIYFKPQHTRFGPVGPSAIDVARALGKGHGIGPTGWSASNALGLSTQVPALPNLAIVGAGPKGIDGVRFHTRSNLRRADLGYLDIALLEVLRAWPRFCEVNWDTMVTRVCPLIDHHKIDLNRIRDAATTERPASLLSRVDALSASLKSGEILGQIAG